KMWVLFASKLANNTHIFHLSGQWLKNQVYKAVSDGSSKVEWGNPGRQNAIKGEKPMQAVRLVEVGQQLQKMETPIPEPGEREVLVRIKAAGICHSDVHYRAGKSPVYPLPMTLGHEIAGVVEAAGEQVTRVKPGDRVVLHYMVACGD